MRSMRDLKFVRLHFLKVLLVLTNNLTGIFATSDLKFRSDGDQSVGVCHLFEHRVVGQGAKDFQLQKRSGNQTLSYNVEFVIIIILGIGLF